MGELLAALDEYREQVRALNKKLRSPKIVERTIERRIDGPVLRVVRDFACSDCPFDDTEEHDDTEARVCGHPHADIASGGSPVIGEKPRPSWCPFEDRR